MAVASTEDVVSSFLEIEGLCDILLSYLDYDTIINLDKSNTYKHDILNFVKPQQIFRGYLNSWKQNKKEISKVIENELWSYGYCKYTLLTIKYEDENSDGGHREKLVDIVPHLTLCDILTDDTFDGIDCYYSEKDQTYKYNLNDFMPECIEYGGYEGDWHKVHTESNYKFANNEFELLLDKLKGFIKCHTKQSESLLNKVKELWNIPNHNKVLKMIKNWYLHTIEGLEYEQQLHWATLCSNDIDIIIYAHIDNDILPKDFITACCEKYQDPSYEHDKCDTFFICRIRIYAEYC